IYVHFTNPLEQDTDNDTLSDDVEIFSLFTNPSSPDTDGDGYSDGTEIAQGTSPLNPSDYPGKPAIDPNILLILIFLGVLIGMMAALILVVWKTRKAKPEPLKLSLKDKST
ncbi:MAG: thrombospondin type 3 repeat-containing protein, partial [Candidatus Helarchaeota archaeon]|nr:thrombospondin type 3 repeat-containing protein [Candidatus Helarchaeota archaeon]